MNQEDQNLGGQEQQQGDGQQQNTAPDTWLQEASTVFGVEAASRDELVGKFKEYGSIKEKYETESQGWQSERAQLAEKATKADRFEKLPMVKSLADFVEQIDPSDPVAMREKINSFIRIQSTDWNAMAVKDPISILMEQAIEQHGSYADKATLEAIVRDKYKTRPEDYPELEPEQAETRAKIALVTAIQDAKAVAAEYEKRKSDMNTHPAKEDRQVQEAKQREFHAEYSKALKEAESSFTELKVDDFTYKNDGKPGAHIEAARQGHIALANKIILNDQGQIDPEKIMRVAFILDNLDNIIKGASGTAKTEAVKEVLNGASKNNVGNPGNGTQTGTVRSNVPKMVFFT